MDGGGEGTASVSTADRVLESEVGELLILLTASHVAHRPGGEVLPLPGARAAVVNSHYLITLGYRGANVQPRKVNCS